MRSCLSLSFAAMIVASTGAALAQPAPPPDPGPCAFDYLIEDATIARDTTSGRQRRDADWNNLDKLVGAPLRRVFENQSAILLLGWEQLPPARHGDGLTPAEMWLRVDDHYRGAADNLRVGQIYEYAIDPGPPFSVRVDTTYVSEPSGGRRRAVGVDIFAPKGCLFSMRVLALPQNPRLAAAGIALEVAALRKAVLARNGAIEFTTESWVPWARYLLAHYLGLAPRPIAAAAPWLAGAGVILLGAVGWLRVRRRRPLA